MANFEQLVFEIIAKDADASAAFARFRRQVDDTSKSVDKSSSSLDKNSQALDRNKQHATSMMGTLIGVGTAFAPITAGAAAAGLGFGAFAALAVPSAKKIATALGSQGGGLAAQWMTLDNRQRNAALGVQDLAGRYTSLARTMEPRTFQVFNTALGFANSLLGPTAKLAASAGTGVESFLVQFSQRAGLQGFITDMSKIAGPAIASVGSDITHIAHAVFQLLQAFSGTGLVELRLLNGVFVTLDTSITFLSQHAPGLTSVALSIGGVALALQKVGALGSVLKVTGLASIATDMTGFAAATRGATLAEKAMLATTTALDAVSPVGWAILATAAVTGLVLWLGRYKTAADGTITSIEKQNSAVGFNTSGYFKAAAALGSYNKTSEQTAITVMNLHTGMVTGTTTIGQVTGATAKLTAAQSKLVTEGRNQQTFLTTLESKYNLTRSAAISLAQHAGVLAGDVNKGGQSMKDATAKAEAYANANLRAQTPTSQLAQDMQDFANKTLTATARTTALTNALKLFFNPAVTADQDVITLTNDQVALAQALQASSGKTGLLTQKQRDARGAFDTYIAQVAQTAQSSFTATGRTSSYTGVINKALPVLERAAGHNKTLRGEIQALINTEKNIRSENVNLHVKGTGSWSVTQGSLQQKLTAGTKFAGAGGGIVPGYAPGHDSALAAVSPGEAILVPELVRAIGAGNILAANHAYGNGRKSTGLHFAGGGVLGSYSGGAAGLSPWMVRERDATARALESSVAAATFAGMKAAIRSASSFGGIAGPGGGAPSANAALAHSLYSALLTPASWSAWNYVAMRESGWNQFARNPSSGAYGIAQALPPTKYPFAGQAAGGSNPMAQIGWMWNYMQGTYGGPIGAARHEAAVNWYDTGYGVLPPGLSLSYNGTGRYEPLMPARNGASTTIIVKVDPAVAAVTPDRQLGRHIAGHVTQFIKSGGRLYPPGTAPA